MHLESLRQKRRVGAHDFLVQTDKWLRQAREYLFAGITIGAIDRVICSGDEQVICQQDAADSFHVSVNSVEMQASNNPVWNVRELEEARIGKQTLVS